MKLKTAIRSGVFSFAGLLRQAKYQLLPKSRERQTKPRSALPKCWFWIF